AHMAAPAPAPAPAAAPQLFSRAAAPGFVVAPAPAPVAPAPAAPVVGGGAPAPVGAPGEAIQVATGALQASRPYQLPNGAGYRGPALREGQVHGALHTGGSPVPPALASQVQSMVYGHGGAVPDPLLVWSSSSRGQIVPQGVPVPGAPMAPAAAPMPVPVPVAPAPSAPAVRTVPMEPPAGAYGGAAPQPASADPFLARAEQGGGAVSFG
ncbi:MAG: hypothetical protein JWM98_974, partial [Thermoleophilia bacterium]|nr:hypothetical protein [Thermoleophilia bacterium]